ncbi:MAG: hypothetical protein FWE97_04310 [Dehalococcoidia bacterium]|nr:hypothetical protein [Dehalococcoidia bacterium]
MDAWIQEILRGETFGFMVLVASFLFGVTAAFFTAKCSGLPAMLVILGYSSTGKMNQRRQLLMTAGAFAISTIVILGILGALISYIGGDFISSTSRLGFYSKKVLGVIALFLGLLALDLVPVRLPAFKLAIEKLPSGPVGALVLGATIGLTTASCAVTCAPLQMPVVIGLAILSGRALEGAIILMVFAIGFVTPMIAAMLGLGFTRATKIMERIATPLRYFSGVFLVLTGLWLLAMIKNNTFTGF